MIFMLILHLKNCHLKLQRTDGSDLAGNKKLELFPKSHQDRLVGRYAGKEYKQLIIDNYIAIFKVDENKKKYLY